MSGGGERSECVRVEKEKTASVREWRRRNNYILHTRPACPRIAKTRETEKERNKGKNTLRTKYFLSHKLTICNEDTE
jgi:hypothetical protein